MLNSQRSLRSARRITSQLAGQYRPAPLPSRPVVADAVDMGELLRFKDLMANDGQAVHLARMCYDKAYAFERIACGHASAHDPLRRLSLCLFKAYQRRDDSRQSSS